MLSRNFLWVLPFFFFFIGYGLMSIVCSPQEFTTPPLIGTSLLHALSVTSAAQLNPRIINVRTDADLPEGTVMSQTPAPGQRIKAHQSMYLEVSQKPLQLIVPELRQKNLSLVTQIMQDMNLNHKTFYVPSTYPSEYCCAQIPEPQDHIDPASSMICYVKNPKIKPIVWPQFVGKPLNLILEYLTENNLSAQVIHQTETMPTHDCNQCIIFAQRPTHGSIMTIDKDHPPLIQLSVK